MNSPQLELSDINDRLRAQQMLLRGRTPTREEAEQLHSLIGQKLALERQLPPGESSFYSGLERVTGERIYGGGGRQSFAHQLAEKPFGKFIAANRGRMSKDGPLWTTPPLLLIGFQAKAQIP